MSVEDSAEAAANRGGNANWQQPLDIIGAPELVGWPELTAECLPAPLHYYVAAEAERLGVDPCPIAAHVLAACSSGCSDAWRAKPRHYDDRWTQQPRLWSCVVKDVGARGTEMIRSGFWPIQQRERKLRAEWAKKTAEFMERKENGDLEKGEKPPACERISTSDATVEAACQALSEGNECSKLTIMCDELVTFVGSFGRYDKSAAARALWLESYDGGPKNIDRILRGNVFVPNWSIVVAGNIQPRKLAGMGKDLIDDGLFQRFMTVHTKPSEIVIDDDQPMDKSAGSDYRKMHEALAKLAPAISAEGEFAPAYFDPDARAVRKNFLPLINRLRLDPTFPMIIRETAPKWSGLLVRIALVFHLVGLADRVRSGESLTERDRCRITGPTVDMAATWLRKIALPNLFRLGFETMPEAGATDGHARWIAGHILSHRLKRITARDVGRVNRALRGKLEETQQAMEVLVDASWASRTNTRRDSECWTVNPAVHVLFAQAAAAERNRREAIREALAAKVSEL